MRHFFSALFLLVITPIFSQKTELSALLVPDSLKQNANAVIRLDQVDISIASQRDMQVSHKRIITIFNENGMRATGAVEGYDKRTRVRSIEATVFDASGNELKKLRRKDFRDQCVLDGITLFSDNRIIYLDYTPTQYPITIVYESDVQTSNTAQIPQWYPMNQHFVSIEKSILNVYYPENVGFRKKEFNFSNFPISKTADNATRLSYETHHIPAQKDEYFSPDNFKVFPWVMMGIEKFNLEGVDGTAKTWKEFGKWYSDTLLSDTNELPEETKTKIIALVGTETDAVKKAKIVYDYVQQKSRYVSIQVGIGGFKPMPAKDVDRLGYGDCKALTNYTKALLNVVGVPSYHTVLYGDRDKIDIESEFISVQGNHMILSVPVENKYIWLECTSQDGPFGYQANFTDDRNVLVIKPEGGEILKTKDYQDKDNAQITRGNYTLSEDGTLSGQVSIVSEGSQYGYRYKLEHRSPKDQDAYYKEYWGNINNLKINKMSFVNDRNKIQFTEDLTLDALQYGKFTGQKMIFPVNAYNQYSNNIKKIKNRKTAFEIQRGSYDVDEIAISLPNGFSIESLPKDMEINTKFGEYRTQIIKTDATNILYKRSQLLKKGYYQNHEYEAFRLYMEQIEKNDNAKIILTKT